MKRTVAAISFILIFIMIISASVITAGAIVLDGADNNGEWKDYDIVKTFNDDSVIEGGFIKAAKETGKDSETTINFLIYAEFKQEGGKPEDPGIIFKFEDNGINEIYLSEGTDKLTKSDNQKYKIIAVNKYHTGGSYYCEIKAEAKDGLDNIVDLTVEFRNKPFEEGEPHAFNNAYSVKASFESEEATKTTAPKTTTKKPTTEKTTKEKTTKEKTTKTTTEKATTTKPEKTSTTKATTTVTTEISHRTRRTTTAKPTTEKETEKTAKAKTTKAAEVKTTKAKTTKVKKASTKAEKSTTERYYSAEAAESTTVITSAEITSEQTSVSTATQTEKSLFGGEKLSKSSLYKLITGAVALLLFAIIGVSAVRTKSAADKAEEKPFSEKEKEEEKEDKKE
jgi:hypothetical protein